MKFSGFSSNEIRLLCFQNLTLALSLLSTWVETSKITSKKKRLCCFLSKSPGGRAISFQIKAWIAFELSYLFIELFYIGVPVVRMDVRATVTWLQKFLGWVDYHIFLPMVLRFTRWGEKTKRVSRLRSRSWPASIRTRWDDWQCNRSLTLSRIRMFRSTGQFNGSPLSSNL